MGEVPQQAGCAPEPYPDLMLPAMRVLRAATGGRVRGLQRVAWSSERYPACEWWWHVAFLVRVVPILYAIQAHR